MIKNYLKVALRNFSSSKLTTLINVGSLALGIACCIIIILFVKNDWTFDQFHSNKERLYRLYTKAEFPGAGVQDSPFTPFNMTRLIDEDYEDMEQFSTFSSFPQQVEHQDQNFPEVINVVSEGFLKMFDFPVLSGSTKSALENETDLVINRAIAEKYFIDLNNAVGNELKMTLGEEDKTFNVVAVVDVPSNSSLKFDFLISDENARLVYPDPVINTWHMIMGTNYVMLKDGVTPEEFEAKLPSLVDKVLGEDRERAYSIHLQPMLDIHLNSEFPAAYASVSDPKYTYILSGIAALILLLGSVNFMILSVGKAASRAKEIGVRKVIGANRKQLGFQLMSEGILMALFSLIFAIIIAYAALPVFNELANTGLQIELSLLNIALFIGLTVIVGLVASIYPALIISSFSPNKVLKGNFASGSKKHYFKMALVTTQFVLSIFLVSSTVLMQKQLNYLQNKNLGFDAEQVVSIPINTPSARGLIDQVSQGFEKAQLLRSKLQAESSITDIGAGSQNFGAGGWIMVGWNEPETEELKEFRMNIVDPGYIPTLDIAIKEGRNFERDNLSDQRRGVIVNEAFVKAFELDNPIGAKIPNPMAMDHEIIGVVNDFHFASLHTSIEPLILVQNINIGFSVAQNINMEADPSVKVLTRIAPNSFQETIAKIESAWIEVYGDEPFDYAFMDEGLKTQYEAEQNLAKIVSISTVLALIIGCMGLFALATLTMNARLKEISVRKVLGAPLNSILMLLSRSYVIIIIIALIVSVPLTVYFTQNWLSAFEYRIAIGADSFLLAGGATLLIALLSIAHQCLKVAHANPAEALSGE